MTARSFLVWSIAAVFLAGCKKTPAPQAAGPLPVNFVTVVEQEVREWDEFTGRLEAVESVEIRPRVSGYITEIHFQAGAIIKAGDLLYVIDPRPYRADYERAAAEFERTQAQLKLSEIELERARDLRKLRPGGGEGGEGHVAGCTADGLKVNVNGSPGGKAGRSTPDYRRRRRPYGRSRGLRRGPRPGG